MDIKDLKDELLQGKIRPAYVFTGDELSLQDIYVDKICELTGYEKVRINSFQAIYNKIWAKTLFKSTPKVYIVRNDDLYSSSEKAWKKVLSAPAGGNIIVFLYSGVDKRSKFIKSHENIATDFGFVGESILKNRVQALTKWPIQYCIDLVRMCGCNYGRIEKELYKLTMLAEVNNYSMQTAYLEAKKHNMIHQDIGDIIFEFTNSIVDRDVAKAYYLYRLVKQTEDGAALKLVTVLYNGFRNIMLVQSTHPKDRTEQVLGLPSTQIYVTAKKCDRYDILEIVNIVKLLQKVESGLKTGQIDPQYAMEYVMAEIF